MKHFTKKILYQLTHKFFLCQFAAALCFWPAFSQLPTEFQRVELATGLTNSVNFEFAPDGRIFIVDRYGELLIYKPDQQLIVSAGTIQVFHDLEDGLLGIEFDPNFLSNNYIYLHYSPLSSSVNRVSRFTMSGDLLNLGSEIIMLEWPTQREVCCHAAGDLAFDSQGNLYVAIGDNTNHSLYATLDETDSNLSSEKSASNTNDLRGKILRITPQPDGTYNIPAGNLFSAGEGLPEIYVMGARNPYKIFVDKENTDWLFWGEVGPDANVAGPEGPVGLDEINLTKDAGNYGWPYLSGKNEPYRNDYANPPFYYDPNAPVNISIWNTGATNLPPAQPAWIDLFHESYLAGPRYYYDPAILDQQKLPIEFDQIFFYYDFNTSQIWAVTMDNQGIIQSNEQLAPSVFPSAETGFIDMKIGPDGHMYILEYGEGCCPGNVGSGKLVRVDYIGVVTNSSPVVVLAADPDNGSLPLNVSFSSAGTFDPDGDPLTYEWDFDGDGTFDSNLENPTFNYTVGGQYNVQLRVSDDNGGVSTSNTTIHAGNNATSFNFVTPPDGGFIDWNDEISFEVTGSDLEDGTIDCSNLNVVPSIGHLNHFHDDLTIDGCLKDLTLDPLDHNIYGEMDIFYVLGVNYTDQGGLTAFDQIRLHPKRKEAEFYDTQNDIAEISNNDPWGGGSEAIRVNHDSYISFEGRNLSGISSVRYRVASAGVGGRIELRLDDPTGALLSTTNVPTTGAWNSWIDVESAFTDPGGKHDLYFVFKNNPGESDLFNLNWVEFTGSGVSVDNTPPEVEEIIALDLTTVSIEFSEAVAPGTAENAGNYQIDNGIIVTSAALQEDNRTVILTTSQIIEGQSYNLTITGVQNEAGIAIVPGSHSFSLFVSIRINAGGPQVNAGGNIFSADQFSTGGDVFENIVSINNTNDDVLYQSERFGADLTYAIPVSNQGAYDVRLHFAEIYIGVDIGGGIGDRIFNVSIEGNPVLSNFDILTEVAPATALVKEINNVIVNDGVLTIQFTGVVENAKISAIEILDPNTFDATPNITVLSPSDGADVNQPFQVGFSVENWEVAEGSTHMHYFIDGLMIEPHYSLNPITIDDLSLGIHTIRLELFEASHTATGVFDEVTVNVTDQVVCSTTPFPDQWNEHLIDGALPYRSVYILPQQDIDGDGLKDIVTGGWWYKNPGSADGNWVQNVIGSPFNNVTWIYDFDGDGDQDLFGTQGQYESADLVWAENNGSGNFTVHSNLPSGTTSHDEVFIAGIAGGVFQAGGLYQMAITWNGAENGSSEVQMVTVPADPVNGTWTIENIHPTSIGEGLSAGDIDDDGDLDLFQAGNWLRNDAGTWTLFSTGITFNSLFDRNRLTDLDRDGDLDGVAGQIGNNEELAWLEAPDDPTQPWTKQVIDPLIDGTLSLGVADMDFDGDEDVIVGEFGGQFQLFGFENDLCNSGTWIKHTIDAGGDGLDHHDGSQLVDIDNDGDLDIITLGWNQIVPRIFENLSGPFIANLPPVLNSPTDHLYSIGESINIQISGTDPNPGDILTYSATGLPADLTINSTSGLISGILSAPVGDYVVTVRLTDQDGLFDEEVFTITVTDVSVLRRINSGGPSFSFGSENWIADQYFIGGKTFSTTSTIDGTSNDELYQTERYTDTGSMSYEVPLPSGDYQVQLHFAEIFYTSAGSRVFDVDIEGGQGELTDYDIFVAAGGINTAVIETFTVTVADGGLTINFTSNVENAKISGIEILGEGNIAPSLIDPGSQQYTPGEVVSLQLEGSDPNLGDVLTFSAIGLPGDLSIDETSGLISGALTAPIGDYVVTIRLTDQDGLFDEIQFTISITGSGNIAPSLTNPGNIVYNGGQVNLLLEGIDLNAGDVLTYSVTGLPSDLVVDPSSGLISGTITASPGTYNITARVTDQGGLFDEVTFTITITNFDSLLRINSGGPGFTIGTEQWVADQYFNGGLNFSTTASIDGTVNDQLYQTERYAETGVMSYAVPLPPGDYQVVLHFAEIFHTTAGSRVFDVNLEDGQGQLVGYDIFIKAGGANKAVFETFIVTITDGELNIDFTSQVESAKISGIEINGAGNIAPVLTNPGTQVYTEGSNVNLQLQGSDLNVGDVLTFSATGLPAGLVINGTSGLISGILTASDGDYSVTVRLEDQEGLFDEETFTISIGSFTNLFRINSGGPSFTFGGEDWIADQYFTGGMTFSTTAAISGTTNDVLYQTERYANAGTMNYEIPLPPGDYQVMLHFAEIFHNSADSRVFDVDIESGQHQLNNYDIFAASGGSNAAIVETFMVTVTDGGLSIAFTSQVESAKLSGIEINEGLSNSPPVIDPVTAQTVSEGSTLSVPITATDEDGDFPVLSVNFLPPFASFTDNMDGTGSLFLAPGFSDMGTYNINVTATDNGGSTDTERIIIQVVNENGPPELATIGNLIISEGELLNVALSATDPDQEITVLSINGNPPFVALTDNQDGTGVLLISPGFMDAGIYSITIVATDPNGLAGQESFDITVLDVNGTPGISVESSLTVEEGSSIEIQVTAFDPDGDIPVLTAANLPEFVTLVDLGNGTGTLTISPAYNEFGVYSFSIIGTDASGLFDEKNVNLNVTEVTESPTWVVSGEAFNANCLNENGSIALSASGGFGMISFKWSNGEETKDISNLPAGLYTVTITDEKNNVFTESFTINLQPGPQKPVLSKVDETTLSTELASNYQWTFNGTDIPGATGQTLEVTLAGEYAVVAGDELGCKTVSDPIEITFDQSSLNFYPNPTNGQLSMELVLVEADEISLVLIDEIGRDTNLGVFNLQAGRHRIAINLDESLANGAYTILSNGKNSGSNVYRILLIK